MQLTVQAEWFTTGGMHYLNIATYQGRVEKLGDRWSWRVTHRRGISDLFMLPFDHGTTGDLEFAKAAVELAIARHNESQ